MSFNSTTISENVLSIVKDKSIKTGLKRSSSCVDDEGKIKSFLIILIT